ncbi:hypothetical protein NQ318_006031 [Aromia moschata]|uniref:Gfo/Idh/MocA-like oxidoreductase N-terminal domain-containing protein n=1 Tax=Aromia moschata TaxID=1265417 RepID=A0AAV8Z1Z3_9CUCU|nr:hypothetical protein NQ318_006031 [Aromia moschata]
MALRWGIAGAGRISHDFVSALGAYPIFDHQVVAVAATSDERAEQFAADHNIAMYYGSYKGLAHDVHVDDAASVVALHSVREAPRLPLRRRAIETEISKSHLQRIFKLNRILPFKPKFSHTVEEGDEAKRLEFCLEMSNRVLNDSFKVFLVSKQELWEQEFGTGIPWKNESSFKGRPVPNIRLAGIKIWQETAIDYQENEESNSVLLSWQQHGSCNPHFYNWSLKI